MRTLAAIVLLLAVFGASTQCVATCLTPSPKLPPCHQHSKGKSSDQAPCKLVQPVADAHAVVAPSTETPALAEAAFEFFTPAAAQPESAVSSFNVLRL